MFWLCLHSHSRKQQIFERTVFSLFYSTILKSKHSVQVFSRFLYDVRTGIKLFPRFKSILIFQFYYNKNLHVKTCNVIIKYTSDHLLAGLILKPHDFFLKYITCMISVYLIIYFKICVFYTNNYTKICKVTIDILNLLSVMRCSLLQATS